MNAQRQVYPRSDFRLGRVLLAFFCGSLLAVGAWSQVTGAATKANRGKLFVAEVKGDASVTVNNLVHTPVQSEMFNATGAVIQTRAEAYNAYVYSNGTGMFVGSESLVRIERFDQERFAPEANTLEVEPSITRSDVHVARGFVGICTNRLVSGTTMNYSTPHAAVNIRGQRVGIETNADETTIYLIEGDVTVRSLDLGGSGQVLRPGEQAVIRPAAPGRPASISISTIPDNFRPELIDRVSVACRARRTVLFDTQAQAGTDGASFDGQDVVARPTVPGTVPPNLVVSPDRLPGTE